MTGKYYVAKKPQHFAIQHMDEAADTTVVDLELRRTRGDGFLSMELTERHMQQIADFLNDLNDKHKQ